MSIHKHRAGYHSGSTLSTNPVMHMAPKRSQLSNRAGLVAAVTSPIPHLHQDWAHPATSAPRLGSPLLLRGGSYLRNALLCAHFFLDVAAARFVSGHECLGFGRWMLRSQFIQVERRLRSDQTGTAHVLVNSAWGCSCLCTESDARTVVTIRAMI